MVTNTHDPAGGGLKIIKEVVPPDLHDPKIVQFVDKTVEDTYLTWMNQMDEYFDKDEDLREDQGQLPYLTSIARYNDYHKEILKALELKDQRSRMQRLKDLFNIWSDPVMLRRFALTFGELGTSAAMTIILQNSGVANIDERITENMSEAEILGLMSNVSLYDNHNVAALILFLTSRMLQDAYRDRMNPVSSLVKNTRELLWFAMNLVPVGIGAAVLYPFAQMSRVHLLRPIRQAWQEGLMGSGVSENDVNALIETNEMSSSELVEQFLHYFYEGGALLYRAGMTGGMRMVLEMGEDAGEAITDAFPQFLDREREDHAIDISAQITQARQLVNTANVAVNAPSKIGALAVSALSIGNGLNAAMSAVGKRAITVSQGSLVLSASVSTLVVLYDYAVTNGDQALADTMSEYIVNITSSITNAIRKFFW